MNPFQNFDDRAPLVSVIVSMHAGDAHFWPRALASLRAQELPHSEMDVLIAFDGPATPEIEETLSAQSVEADFNVQIFSSQPDEPPTGYYTGPRNRVTPLALGYYIANLDVDNEWRPGHLSGLLAAIRLPAPGGQGWPHFTYSRREYVIDPGATPPRGMLRLPEGPSPLTEWTPENVQRLLAGPMNNFIDTSDFLVGKSVLYGLAEASGHIWNPEARRFGDWDLIARMARCGFRGRAVDQVTNVYHFHGGNVQLTRTADGMDLIPIPADLYEKYVEEGKIVPEPVN